MLACSNNPNKDQNNDSHPETSNEVEVSLTQENSIEESPIKETETVETIPENEVIGFEQTARRISEAQNSFELTISENFGVYLIEQPGAMPTVKHVYTVEASSFSEAIKMEALPKVICDETVYDKQGCFAEAINPLIDSQIWNHTKMNEKEKQAIISLVYSIKYTVIDTENKFTYYFSEIEGEYFLTFIDLRTPCEA